MFTHFLHELHSPLALATNCAERIRLAVGDNPKIYKLVVDLQVALRMTKQAASRFEITVNQNKVIRSFKQLMTPTQIDEIVRSCMEDTAYIHSAEKRNISCRIDSTSFSSIPQFFADSNLLRQAIYNLIDNAYKYSSTGSQINISARSDSIRIFLITTNHGLVFSADDAAYAANRGWRGGEARLICNGSGLGLWMVSKIAEAHDGNLVIIPTDSEGLNRVTLSWAVR